MKRNVKVATAFVAGLAMLGAAIVYLDKKATVEAAGKQAPRFEVDPMWPKPLPNHWIMGTVIGVSVDDKDNVWVIHRGGSLEAKEVYATTNPPSSECCKPAPSVLAFNQAGDLLHSWGGEDGPGFEWPASNHGVTVDFKGNVWLGGNGRSLAPASSEEAGSKAGMKRTPMAKPTDGLPHYHDSMVLKFTQDGKFLSQIGKVGGSRGSNDTENLGLPAKTLVDPKTNELYVADGYGNRRVIVFDAETGKYKRHWGAYGEKPDDSPMGPYNPNDPPAKQFRSPVHCAELSNDGMVYVCDRSNDRIQVFTKDGKFVKEKIVAKTTKGDGAIWDIAFSKDAKQTYMYVADGANEKVYIMDRESLDILTSFGDGGRQPGAFYAVHSIATDSKGNVYTTETYRGQRVQKFNYKGLAPVTKMDQGVVWPKK